MDLEEAVRKAGQILDDERTSPTSRYARVYPEMKTLPKPEIFKVLSDQISEVLPNSNYNLPALRKLRPRPVNEVPGKYEYKGTNFDLLKVILSHIKSEDRETFITCLAERIQTARVFRMASSDSSYPEFLDYISELPLLAEFSIRTGYIVALFKAIMAMDKWNAAFLLLLMQIEDMIALDFTVFSENSLQEIPKILKGLLRKLKLACQQKPSPRLRLPNESVVPQTSHPPFINEIERVVGSIDQACNKALYLYLKGQLQLKANTEVNGDRERVVGFLTTLGFSKEMTDSLDAAEREYSATATPFELKNSLGHLRSFLEHLHRDAACSIAAASGEVVTDRWGESTTFLRRNGYFSQKEEEFVCKLYTLISDESVHPLIAEQEYARLFRNVVIEYGLMFLSTLDKKGIKLLPPASTKGAQ